MENLIEINCQFLSNKKVLISCEDGYVSSKQVFDSLGLKARSHMPKLADKPFKLLTSTRKPDSQGNLPQDIVEALKMIQFSKSSNPSGLKFMIEFLPELVKNTGLSLTPQAEVFVEPLKPKIIDCDLLELDFLDLFRKDASFLDLLPDEINAMVATQVVQLFDPTTGKRRRTIQLKDSNTGEFRKLQKLGFLNEKQACHRFPAEHIFDQRVWFNQVDTIESVKTGKIIYMKKYDFVSPKPWITEPMIIHAENLRSQIEREQKEQTRLKLIAEMEIQYGVQKPSAPRIQSSA